MEKQKMTIHRALSELKVLDSRISKSINEINPIGAKQKDKLVNGTHDEETFISNAQSKFESINDLITRKTKIKSAIVESNSKTQVTIGEKTMSVADAITFKDVVSFKKQLLSKLAQENNKVLALVNKNNEGINNQALENARIMLGREGDSKLTPSDKDVEAVMSPFVERHKFTTVDPLQIEKKIEELEREIEGFTTEVDAVLSESNAITFIEI